MSRKEKKQSTEGVEKEQIKSKKEEKIYHEDSNSMKKNKNASFIQRLGAYLLDAFLITMIISIITVPFTTSNNYERLSEESNKIIEEYTTGKIDMNTYLSRVSDISYDMSRETGLSVILSIAIYILYFIIYQYYHNGQTLGKKIMKIRIERIDDEEVSINMILMRSLIINSILADLVILTLSILGNRDVYFIGTGIFEGIQYLILFITAIMVLSRKDKRGLHDIVCHTKVVNVEDTK